MVFYLWIQQSGIGLKLAQVVKILIFMVTPRFASTVVLLRPDENGSFDILLTRRPPEMRFLGGFYVFPGGTVHEEDYSARILQHCRGLSGNEARNILGNRHDPQVAIGHWIAAIRELFEEVGVLLCESRSSTPIDWHDQTTKERFEVKRRAIVRKELDLAEFLESEELYSDLSRMVYFFHRVTPAIYSMRFDTRFYLAVLPAHQTPLSRSEEVTHSLWIKPAVALSQVDRYDFPILPPTTTVLEDLAEIPSWDDLCATYRLG
jgi:8-oxo-dGTP pyrophosphatase MutT (NUDIX family)